MRIKELIKEKGYTQKEFAKKIGMSPVGLSQIVNGNPSYTTMVKIAQALDVEVWELFVSRNEVYICPNCGAKIRIPQKAV